MSGGIVEWIRGRPWSTRARSEWVEVEICPLCAGGKHGDRWTFAIHSETGGSVCHRSKGCGWHGSFADLRERMGDVVPVATSATSATGATGATSATGKSDYAASASDDLWRGPHAALVADELLGKSLERRRGLSRSTIKRFEVGVVYRSGKPWLVLPYRNHEGRLAYVKRKSRTEEGGKQIMREPSGTASVLFGEHLLEGSDRIVVVEGEEDAMLLCQHGVRNVVSVPDGANVSASNPPNWCDTLAQFDEVVVALDDDSPGRAAALRLVDAVGRERCRIVRYPAPINEEKDATDYWRSGRIEELVSAIESEDEESTFLRAGSRKLRDSIMRQYRSEEPLGFSTGWRSVDKLLGGVRPGEVTILTAHTGAGKSALATNLALNAATARHPVLCAALEISAEDATWRFLQQIVGRFPWRRRDVIGKEMTEEDIERGFARLEEIPLHLLNHWGSMGVEEFSDAARIAKRKHKVELVVLDHLHFMVAGNGDDYLAQIASGIKALKALSVELEMSFLVVCHANRAAKSKGAPGLTDLFGSSALEQIADNVLTLERVVGGTNLYGAAKLSLIKLRAGRCGNLGTVGLSFSKAAERFYELAAPDEDDGMLRYNDDNYTDPYTQEDEDDADAL